RDRNMRDLKSTIVRPLSDPDQLLPFLDRFLQGPGDWCDIKDGPLLERHASVTSGPALSWGSVCACAGNAAQTERPISVARRLSLNVISRFPPRSTGG